MTKRARKRSKATRRDVHRLASLPPSKREDPKDPKDPKEARGQQGDLIPLSEIKAKRRTWLWEPYIPFGAISLLTGKQGDGKSTLGSEIGAIATTDRCFPGTDVRLAPMNVAIVVREEDVEIEPRARAVEQGADLDRLLVVDPKKPLPWANVRDGKARMETRNAWLEDMIRRRHIRVFIFDPISSAMVHETGNALREELTELARLFARHNCACVGISQLTKAWGGTVIGSIRGGGAWSEVARSVCAVARLDPSDGRSVVAFGVVKANMAVGDASYLAYRLVELDPRHRERVRLEWVDDANLPPHVSLDNLIKQACKEGKTLSTKSAKVDAVLLELLANGLELTETEVKQEVKARTGAGDRTIEERKRALHIESHPRTVNGTRRWYWSLPAAPQPAAAPSSPTGGQAAEETAVIDAAALPLARYVEQEQAKGRTASQILAKLESVGGKEATEQDAEQTTDTNAAETEKKAN